MCWENTNFQVDVSLSAIRPNLATLGIKEAVAIFPHYSLFFIVIFSTTRNGPSLLFPVDS